MLFKRCQQHQLYNLQNTFLFYNNINNINPQGQLRPNRGNISEPKYSYYLPEPKPFVEKDKNIGENTAENMAKMLRRKEITSVVVPPTQKTTDPTQPVRPGQWVFIRVMKRETWHSPKCTDCSSRGRDTILDTPDCGAVQA